jgi:hypothetical protein
MILGVGCCKFPSLHYITFSHLGSLRLGRELYETKFARMEPPCLPCLTLAESFRSSGRGGRDRLDTMVKLESHGLLEGPRIIAGMISRIPIEVHTFLWEPQELFCKRDSLLQSLAFWHNTVREPHRQGFSCTNRTPCQDHVQ